ncbi:MAG: leucine-rich repeat protein, partial [Bacteroidales bacterium]|nr:leucine-rich repeat protein [Bacteroidales bacterium]
MKKIVLTLLSIVFSVTLMGQTTFTIGELTYTVIGGGNNVSVKRAQNLTFENLVIPSQVEYVNNGNTYTYTVTKIEDDAFYYCQNLTSAYIPNTIEVLGNSAFQYCSNLESISFGEHSNLTNIGDNAFQYCSS